MRLSATQKDILFILYAIQSKGRPGPIPGLAILNMINTSRPSPIAASNFRTGCHSLVKHQLLERHRNSALQLAFKLTEPGQTKGQAIYEIRQEPKP